MANPGDNEFRTRSAAGHRRFLTVLFADLCDSSRLAANVDAELFAQVLSELRGIARNVVGRHGGRIARIQGDGVLAVFGYPTPSEDDARRAVEAAIDLRADVERLRVAGLPGSSARIGVHAGIHAGLVLVVDGDIERGRFDLVGDIPNTAAWLCGLANDGDICVSDSALGPAAQFFVAQAPRAVTLKGSQQVLRVRNITGRAALQRRYEASASQGLAAFVGRTAAWSSLQAQWQRSQQGSCRCALVTGQPGLGKTRLVEEFARATAADGALVLRGFCESYLAAEPLQPFLQMLRAAAGAPGTGPRAPLAEQPASASAMDRLLAEAGAPASMAGGSAGVPAAIAAWVAQLAAGRPVLMLLDDWQWADDASRQALDQILALQAPVLALVASRSVAAAALGERVQDTVELAPLAADDARRVVHHWLPGLDPFLCDEIYAYAGGIPLFVEELCHAVAAGGRLQPALPSGGTAWLATLIESRVERLAQAPAELLRVAAVLGNAFPQWLFERVTGCAADDPRLQLLAEQDFVFAADQPGLLRFKHGITRDAVYATVGLAERQRLHGRVAAMLEAAHGEGGEPALEALAYHFSAAGAAAQAAAYAERAGDKAMAANALDSARAQYTAALRELDCLPELAAADRLRWCSVAQRLGMACVFDPISIPDRERLLERAVALARQAADANAQARAEYWLGYTRYAVGRARAGLPHCTQALALAQASGDQRLAAQVRATLGQALVAVCRYGEALPLLDDAIASKRRGSAPGGSMAIGSAYALASKGLLLTDRGAFADADDCFDQARTLLGGSAHPVASSVCGLMGIALLWQARWQEAAAIADEGARIADNSRSRQLLAMGRSIAGYARWVSAGDAGGLAAIGDAVQWIEARGGRFMISLLYGWLLDGTAAAGAPGEATRRHAASLLRRGREGDLIGQAMGCRALARLALAQHQPERAARWLARAEQAASVRQSAHEVAHNQVCRALLDSARGQPQRARAALLQACDGYGQLRLGWYAERAAGLLERA